MNCLSNLDFTFPALLAAGLGFISAVILIWVLRNNHFAGKTPFALSMFGVLWWLVSVTFEVASPTEVCKVNWSLAAWPGITLQSIAWAVFIFDYTMNPRRQRKVLRRALFIGIPVIAGLIAATNGQFHLLYGTDTHLVTEAGRSYVVFDHGPLFYAVVSVLYIFVWSSQGVLILAFTKARQSVRPFLAVLFVVTLAALAANFSYVIWGLTFFGSDPTPYAFAGALITLSWMLLNNTMMDIKAQGRNLLFYATRDPVLLMEADGRFAGANAAAVSLFGDALPSNGAALENLTVLRPVLGHLSDTGALTGADPLRIAGRAFDPRALPIESPIRTTGNVLGWVISLVDITERERSAEALREALAQAESANKAKSQFLAMISHELRTPMTSLKGGLDLALHGAAGEVSEPLRNLLTIAQRNSLRLMKLIDDVLDLQKLDLSAISLSSSELDADTFLRDVLEEYQGYAVKGGVRLAVTSAPVNRALTADSNRLKQVIGNVISNAIKFSPRNGSVDCTIATTDTGLRFSVSDSGIGIPQGSEEIVFGRFHQVENGAAQGSGGSGLGLHIAKLLIERMGGGISYTSREGQGTTFYIDVPFEALEATPEA